MIVADSAVVAIEAKFAEPLPEIVGDWLGNPHQVRRGKVLDGWLELIRNATGTALRAAHVRDLPYQLIHRTASVCSISRPLRAVVYQVFGEALRDFYADNLSKLWERLGRTPAMGFHVLSCSLNSLPSHKNLEKLWKQRYRYIGPAIRDALLTGPLFSFGEPTSQLVMR
jgi:hypothetical protein